MPLWLMTYSSSNNGDTVTAVIKMFPVIGITIQNQFTKRMLSACKNNILDYLIMSNTHNNCLLSKNGKVKVNVVIFLT